MHCAEMEAQLSSVLAVTSAGRSEVDTTRPFRSVKEAVAVFGERLLTGEPYSQKTNIVALKPVYALPAPQPIYAISAAKPPYSASSSPRSYSSSSSRFNPARDDDIVILDSIKRLEAELVETKRELTLLKERESEMEIAVATLNAELHKSMSKLAQIEAAGAAKAAKKPTEDHQSAMMIRSKHWQEERTGYEHLPSLAEALCLGEVDEALGGGRKVKLPKKKPIVPLVGDMFSRKKASDFDNSLYTRPFYGVFK